MKKYARQIVIGALWGTLLFVTLHRGGIPLLSHVIFVAGVLFVVFFGLLGVDRTEKERPLGLVVSCLFFLFFASFILSFFNSIGVNYGVSEFFLFGSALILFTAIQRIRFTEGQREILFKGILYIAFISTFVGIFYYIRLSFNRFTGTFINPAEDYNGFPNAYGNFLLFILPLSVYFTATVKRVGERLVQGILLAFFIGGFVLSFSRGAWISLFSVLIFFCMYASWKKLFLQKEFWKSAGVAAIFITVGIFMAIGLNQARAHNYEINTIGQKASLAADEGSSSTNERLEFWRTSLNIIKDYPFTGTGPGSFKFIYPRYQQTFGMVSDHPHNVFLKLAVENGLITAGLFSMLVLAMLMLVFKNGLYASPLFWGVLGGFLHNNVDYNLNFASTQILLWAFLGLLIGQISDVPSALSLKMPKKKTVLIGITFASFILFLIAGHETYYNKIFRDGRASLEAGNFTEAIPLLEDSLPLIWDRDLPLSLASAYAGVGDSVRAAEAMEEHALSKSIQNAAHVNFYGELIEKGNLASACDKFPFAIGANIFVEDVENSCAASIFLQALRYDPQNNLRYHYNFARTGGLNATKMEELLEMYEDQLSKNAHLTILTENPKYASSLYDLLIANAGPEQKTILNEKKKKFQEVWLMEQLKFSLKYSGASKDASK